VGLIDDLDRGPIARSSAFLTNDRKIPAMPGLRIVQLRDYFHAG
jgi:hypothetical protein